MYVQNAHANKSTENIIARVEMILQVIHNILYEYYYKCRR